MHNTKLGDFTAGFSHSDDAMQAGDRHGAAAAWSTLERVGATLSRVHAQVALLGSNSTGLPHALEAQQTAALSRLWLGENERRVMWPCAESSAWAAPRHAASLLLRTEPGLSSSATKQREAPADAVETHFELASDDVCPPPQKVLDELLRSLPAAERPRVSSATALDDEGGPRIWLQSPGPQQRGGGAWLSLPPRRLPGRLRAVSARGSLQLWWWWWGPWSYWCAPSGPPPKQPRATPARPRAGGEDTIIGGALRRCTRRSQGGGGRCQSA